jgi:hypothetical protein
VEGHWFFGSRSRVSDGPAGGVLVRIDGRALLFVGVRSELVDLAVAQKFDEIVNCRAEVASRHKKVLCTVSNGAFRGFGINEDELPDFRDSGGYAHFTLEGLLRYSREGLVFGVLPIQ